MSISERGLWAEQVGRSILERVGKDLSDSLLQVCGNDPVVAAFIHIHISLCHAEGLTSSRIASQLDGWQSGMGWNKITLQSISAFRRDGVDPPLSDDRLVTWVSLARLARLRTHSAELPELSDAVLMINDDIDAVAEFSLKGAAGTPPKLDFLATEATHKGADPPSWQPPVGWTYRLAAPHLEPYREAIFLVDMLQKVSGIDKAKEAGQALLTELQSWLTPLEFAALLPESTERLLIDEVLRASRRIMLLPYFMIGAWADLYPNESDPRVPDWIHDYVVTGGARSATYTTGSVHGWVLVSEGPWDFARVSRSLRNIEQLGIAELDDSVELSLLLPEYAGDPEPFAIDFAYRLTDVEGLRGLSVLAATGYVRLEVYALASGALQFVGSRALSLPDPLVNRLVELAVGSIREHFDSTPSGILGANLSRLAKENEAENRFVASEISRHELLWHVSLLAHRGELAPADREALEASRLGYLAAESKYAKLVLAGQPVDAGDLVGPSRAEFEAILARHAGRWASSPSSLNALGLNQAFLHVDRRDGGIDWVAAGVGPEGPWYHWSPQDPDPSLDATLRQFFQVRHGSTSLTDRAVAIDRLIDHLNQSVSEMAGMLHDAGITSIVVSPGADLDGIPIHLLDLGPHSPVVTYAPSLRFLDAMIHPTSDTEDVSILHYTGSGSDVIPHVADEASTIANLYGPEAIVIGNATPDDLLEAAGSRIIHIACHGLAFEHLALRGLLLAPDLVNGFVSTADILRNVPMLGTSLVFLSACSTSVADHSTTVVQAFGGVDFAFIATGAAAAVATHWDVNDVSAAIFATAFHFDLSRGSTVIGAYKTAQQALSSDLATLPQGAVEALNRAWPKWRHDWRHLRMRSHRVHWGAFRIAGRA